MDGLKTAIDALEEKARQSIPRNDGDYIGDDGLLYCGTCMTPKQCRIEILGKVRTPLCLCKCETEKRDAERAEQERAEKERRIKDNRRAAFQLDEMSGWTFANDDGENPKITGAMRRYVENFPQMLENGKGLLLYGSVGTGKTFAACEVANALLDTGYRVMVTNFARLINIIQGTFEGRQEYIDSLNSYHLLVIDDLGVERQTDFMREMVYSIIDSRYRAGLPLIVTTNMTIEEIKKPADVSNSRIYDRIIERCFPVEVNGSSRRRKKVRDEYADMKQLLGL